MQGTVIEQVKDAIFTVELRKAMQYEPYVIIGDIGIFDVIDHGDDTFTALVCNEKAGFYQYVYKSTIEEFKCLILS